MRDKATGLNKRLQLDTEGKVIGKLIEAGGGRSYLLLEPDYMLVKIQETGRIRVWDNKERKLVELAK